MSVPGYLQGAVQKGTTGFQAGNSGGTLEAAEGGLWGKA